MKTLYCFLLAITVSQYCHAQITLNNTQYPAVKTGVDTLKKTTYNSSFPSLSAGANGSWDLSTVTDSSAVFYSYRVPCSGYEYADSSNYSFSYYTYQGNAMISFTSSGLKEYSVLANKEGNSLATITGISTDSIIIDSQLVSYSSPETIIEFPASNSTKWSSDYSADLKFKLSVSPAYSYAPGIMRRFTARRDTVVGWGKMRVKDINGNASQYFNVLQVKTIITTTDSYYVNGIPVPGATLGILNLSQGTTTSIYEQNYYRIGEITPLAKVIFTDATYAQPKSATTHVQRVYDNEVANVENDGMIIVFPNPLNSNTIHIRSENVTRLRSYELSDVIGRRIMAGDLDGYKEAIVLPESMTHGVYYLRITGDNGSMSVKTINILR